jgi:hypothetical protein
VSDGDDDDDEDDGNGENWATYLESQSAFCADC